MSAPSALAGRAHLVGRPFAMALAVVSVLAARHVMWLLQGSIVEELGWLTAFGAILAVLAIGDALWPFIARRLDPAFGEK